MKQPEFGGAMKWNRGTEAVCAAAQDIAIMTGAEYIATDLGLSVATADVESLGVARKVGPSHRNMACERQGQGRRACYAFYEGFYSSWRLWQGLIPSSVSFVLAPNHQQTA